MKKDYLSITDSQLAIWLNNWAAKLAVHARTVGVTPEEVAQAGRDAQNFKAASDRLEQIIRDKEEMTKWKNKLRDEKNGVADAMPLNAPPAAAAAAPAENPLPGIKPRVRELAKRIKANANYTRSIGEDLGIVGDEHEVDISTLKPILTLKLQQAGVNIGWKKTVADGIRIYYKDAQGNWIFLAADTEPDYLDTRPITQPEKRTYRAGYFINDEPVGQWSDEASIAVG